MKKRVLSALMALALFLTPLPTASFADVTENGEGSGGHTTSRRAAGSSACGDLVPVGRAR